MDETNINDILFENITNDYNHYIRGCRYLTSCCNNIFDCRFCHDIKIYDEENNIKKTPNENARFYKIYL